MTLMGFFNWGVMYRAMWADPVQHRTTIQMEVPIPFHWLYQTSPL